MKKAMLLAVMAVLFYSCSKEQKCKQLVKDYLSKNLDDFKSYDPVEYSKIFADSSTYYDDKIYNQLKDSTKKLEIRRYGSDYTEVAVDTVATDTAYPNRSPIQRYDFSTKLADSIILYMDKQEIFRKNFKPKQIGWAIIHNFRCNTNGQPKLHKAFFRINMDYSKIISAEIE